MSMNTQGRPTAPTATSAVSAGPETFSGNRALAQAEPLIFEQSSEGRSGVDFVAAPNVASRMGGLARNGPLGLPGLSEPQVVRQTSHISWVAKKIKRNPCTIRSGTRNKGPLHMMETPTRNWRMMRHNGHHLECAVDVALESFRQLRRSPWECGPPSTWIGGSSKTELQARGIQCCRAL